MGQSADDRRHVTTDLETIDDRLCTILHVDMDAFFASVELRRRPELRGKPMMVAGDSRSVVLSATYEARRYGVRSAMPVGAARRLCPDMIVIPPDHAAYRAASADVMAVFADITPLVEPLSVDEAFLDVSGAGRTLGRPGRIAQLIRERLDRELGLTATVGASTTKFIAKLASGLAKPDGLLIVPPDDVTSLLSPLPARALWGVGPKTSAVLESIGLTTVGAIAGTPRSALIRTFGEATGGKLHALANGLDDRTVQGGASEVSIGSETTFAADTADRDQIRSTLLDLADRTARRARAGAVRGRTVAIKIRYADFTTFSRSQTLATPTDLAADMHQTAMALLNRVNLVGRRIRLLGIRLEGLVPASQVTEQLEFGFEDHPCRPRGGAGRSAGSVAHRPSSPAPVEPDRAQWRSAESALDRVHARFGTAAVGRASFLKAAPPFLKAAPPTLKVVPANLPAAPPAPRAADDVVTASHDVGVDSSSRRAANSGVRGVPCPSIRSNKPESGPQATESLPNGDHSSE